MSEQEFIETRDSIKQIFDSIDPISMNRNPDFDNFEVQ
jgi:hypothetical protein